MSWGPQEVSSPGRTEIGGEFGRRAEGWITQGLGGQAEEVLPCE